MEKQTSVTAKRLDCDICGKKFRYTSNLKDHKRIHTGEKPFKCDICSRSFTNQTILTHHRRIHTGEKPYTCAQCSRSFRQKGHLTIHLKTHTPDKPFLYCPYSPSFAQKDALNKDKRIHMAEKMFKSDPPSRSFEEKISLKRPNTLHTMEKPITCDQSLQPFVTGGPLIRHVTSDYSSQERYQSQSSGSPDLGHLLTYSFNHPLEYFDECDNFRTSFFQWTDLSARIVAHETEVSKFRTTFEQISQEHLHSPWPGTSASYDKTQPHASTERSTNPTVTCTSANTSNCKPQANTSVRDYQNERGFHTSADTVVNEKYKTYPSMCSENGRRYPQPTTSFEDQTAK